MNYNEIKKLVKLVESSEIEELELEIEGAKIRITKKIASEMLSNPSMTTYIPADRYLNVPATHQSMVPPQTVEQTQVAPKSNIIEVTSPMVGTFYRSPSPESPPYVNVGDKVRPGQILCILEAMKLMNELECEVSGRIVTIMAENAQPIEFGQILFQIEPD